jgi:hypothetical protein
VGLGSILYTYAVAFVANEKLWWSRLFRYGYTGAVLILRPRPTAVQHRCLLHKLLARLQKLRELYTPMEALIHVTATRESEFGINVTRSVPDHIGDLIESSSQE